MVILPTSPEYFAFMSGFITLMLCELSDKSRAQQHHVVTSWYRDTFRIAFVGEPLVTGGFCSHRPVTRGLKSMWTRRNFGTNDGVAGELGRHVAHVTPLKWFVPPACPQYAVAAYQSRDKWLTQSQATVSKWILWLMDGFLRTHPEYNVSWSCFHNTDTR